MPGICLYHFMGSSPLLAVELLIGQLTRNRKKIVLNFEKLYNFVVAAFLNASYLLACYIADVFKQNTLTKQTSNCFVLDRHQAPAAYCDTLRGCLSVCHVNELYKNGRMDRGAIWNRDSGEPSLSRLAE